MSYSDQSSPNESSSKEMGFDVGARTIFQKDAPSDLEVVSWAPEVPLGKTKAYAYNPESGGEAVIYLIENGIDGRKPVIT